MRYSNVIGSVFLGSTLLVTGCGNESPNTLGGTVSGVTSGVSTPPVNTPTLPTPSIPVSAPDASAVITQINGLLNTVSGMLTELEAIEGTGLNGAVAELTATLNNAQQSLTAALTDALAGNNAQSSSAISDVILDLIGGDLQAVVAQLSGNFAASFPSAADPFASITSNLSIITAAFGGGGDISPALLDNAVAAIQPVLDTIGTGIETIELLSMAAAIQDGLDDIAARPDLVPGIVPHPLSNLSPSLADLQTALQAGNLETALGEAQVLIPLAGLPSLLAELGLVNSPLSGLLPDVTTALGGDFSNPTDRADVIELLAEVVSTVNELLLGLIPHSLDPTFDPLVGAIVALTNLLDNVGGNPAGTSVADALVNDLDGEQTGTAIAVALRGLFGDLFTGVFPVTEITNDMAVALADSSDAITDITAEGVSGVLTPITDTLAPIVTCLEAVEPVGSAIDSLLGLGDAACFVAAP